MGQECLQAASKIGLGAPVLLLAARGGRPAEWHLTEAGWSMRERTLHATAEAKHVSEV